jgi:hypothetical protein
MLKRFVSRLLIVLQIYGNLFQGVVHAADLAESYPIRNQIHLHSSFDESGGLLLSLGTDSPTKGLEVIGVIDVPSYKTLRSQRQPQNLKIQVDLSDSPSRLAGDLLSPIRSTFVPSDDGKVEEDADTDDDSIAFTTQDGIVRLPEGVYFDLQGLQIFMNNEGELLIQGAQTDFTKPIFLSSKKSIVLHSVEASFLKLTSPSVVGVGKLMQNERFAVINSKTQLPVIKFIIS